MKYFHKINAFHILLHPSTQPEGSGRGLHSSESLLYINMYAVLLQQKKKKENNEAFLYSKRQHK